MPFWTAQIPVLYSTVWSDCTLETDRAGHTTRGRCLGDDCPDTGDACVHGWACLDRCPAGPCCAPGGRPGWHGRLSCVGHNVRARVCLVAASISIHRRRTACLIAHRFLRAFITSRRGRPPGYTAHDASRLRADQSFLSSPTTISGGTGLVGVGFNAPLDTV